MRGAEFMLQVHPSALMGGPSHLLRSGDGPERAISIGSREYLPGLGTSVGDVLEQLVALDGSAPRLPTAHAEALGRLLGQVLWPEPPAARPDEVWIRVEDAHAASLPWPLAQTALGGPSLLLQGVPVTLTLGERATDETLPPRPRLLAVMPEPTDQPATDAEGHLRRLRAALPRCEVLPEIPRRKWETLDALSRLAPDILYFYGHGQIRFGGLELLMVPDAKGGDPTLKATELAARLAARPPKIVLLNCCWGGWGSDLGGPAAIAPHVPCLIANRTSALVPNAQWQALHVLELVVQQRLPPHEAVARAMREPSEGGNAAAGLRGEEDEPWWLAPVVYARARDWSFASGPAAGAALTDLHTLTLDRAPHCFDATSCVFDSDPGGEPPRCSVLLWCGEEEQGLDALADRLDLAFQARRDGAGGAFAQVRMLAPRSVPWDAAMQDIEDRTTRYRLAGEALRAAVCGGPRAGDPADAGRTALSLFRMPGVAPRVALLRYQTLEWTEPSGPLQLRAALHAFRTGIAVPLAAATPPVPRVVALMPVNCTGAARYTVAEIADEAGSDVRPRIAARFLPELDSVKEQNIMDWLTSHDDPELKAFTKRNAVARSILGRTGGVFSPTRAELLRYSDHLPD